MTITSERAKEIWRDVKENLRRRRACPGHRFEGGSHAFGQKHTCLVCGTVADATFVGPYLDGFKAAGGDPEQVFPGWFKT